MAIELGALELAIREKGGALVLDALGTVDAKAKQVGAKPVVVAVEAAGATQAATAIESVGTAATATAASSTTAAGAMAASIAEVGTTAAAVVAPIEQVAAAVVAAAEEATAVTTASSTTTAAAVATVAAAVKRVNSTPIAPAVPPAATAKIARLVDGIQSLGNETVVTQAKSLNLFRASAEATTQYLVKIGASEAELTRLGQVVGQVEGRVVASEARKVGAVGRTTTAVEQQGRAFFNASGRIQTLGTKGFTALNALAFGLSQFAATGETSFRSLAISLGSFTAFLGPTGAIASLAITTGLALSDFFTRTQRGITETARKAADEARQAAREIRLAFDDGDRAALTARAKQIFTGTADTKGLRDLQRESAELEAQIGAKRFLINQFARDQSIAEREAAQRTLKGLLTQKAAVDGQLQAAQRQLDQVNLAIQNAPVARGDREAIKITGQRAETQKQISKELNTEIAALGTLVDLRKTNLAAMQRAVELEALLTGELGKQGNTLVRQAELQGQLNKLRQTGLLLTIPKKPAETRGELLPAKRIDLTKQEKHSLGLDRAFTPELTDFEQSLADGLGNAIVNGLATGFAFGLADGGIGEGFKQLGAQMLSGLGNVFLEVGAKAILGSQLLANLAKGLASLNPVFAIAAGVALLALAKAMGGKGGNVGGGIRGGGAASLNGSSVVFDPATSRAVLPPSGRLNGARAAAGPVTQSVTVLGVNSPQGQRLIGEANANFSRRGG